MCYIFTHEITERRVPLAQNMKFTAGPLNKHITRVHSAFKSIQHLLFLG